MFAPNFQKFVVQILKRCLKWKLLRKHMRMVLWRRKMQYWKQCGKKVTGSPKFSGPFTKKDRKTFFWQKFTSLQNDHLYKGNAVLTNVTKLFKEFGKFDAWITKKNMKNFVSIENISTSKWPSVHVEVSSDNRTGYFIPPKVCFLCLKSKTMKK